MHFLILTIEYPPVGGGASPVIHEISKQFIQRGHQVSVVTMAAGDAKGHLRSDGVDIYHIHCFRAHKHISNVWEHISYLLAAQKFLRSFIPKHKIDFCFTHFMVPAGILARWLYGKYHIPYSITTHGSDIPGFNPDRFKLMHRLTPPLIRAIARSGEAVISPSKYLSSLILEMGGIAEQKMVHIPNGIDTDFYLPGNKKNIVLATGRLLERKGFQFLIDAVADEPFPFEVHICGDGPMMSILKAKAAKSKTPVILHGWLNNKSEAYLKLLSEASIFVLVSSKENASISLLEALSSGCVVITSDVSGCPETVGNAGICLPPGDVQALKSTLQQFIAHPDLAETFRKAGRERAITHFSWKKIADQYLSLASNKMRV